MERCEGQIEAQNRERNEQQDRQGPAPGRDGIAGLVIFVLHQLERRHDQGCSTLSLRETEKLRKIVDDEAAETPDVVPGDENAHRHNERQQRHTDEWCDLQECGHDRSPIACVVTGRRGKARRARQSQSSIVRGEGRSVGIRTLHENRARASRRNGGRALPCSADGNTVVPNARFRSVGRAVPTSAAAGTACRSSVTECVHFRPAATPARRKASASALPGALAFGGCARA